MLKSLWFSCCPYHIGPSVQFSLFCNFFARSLCRCLQSNFHLWSLQALSHCTNEKQFGILRQVVDLLGRTEESMRRNPNNLHIELMWQYYRKHLGRNKFKYDHQDCKWIDVDWVISTITMSHKPKNEVYTLDRNDLEQLSKFVVYTGILFWCKRGT